MRENLALAIALWRSAQGGLINVSFIAHFDAAETRDPPAAGVPAPLQVQDTRELVRCANNQIRAAFAFSVRQTHRTLVSHFGGSPTLGNSSESQTDLQAARCILHLLDLTFDTNPMTPTWVCPPEYRGSLAVKAAGFRLDTTGVHGQEVQWSDFGGLHKYLDLLAYCAEIAREAGAPAEDTTADNTAAEATGVEPAIATTNAQEPPPGSSYPPVPDELPVPVSSPPAALPVRAEPVVPQTTRPDGHEPDLDSVSAFLSARCVVGEGELILAALLFDAYLEWCAERGCEPVGQRRFGMHLTAAGLERRRRGRGKHWWMGVGLPEPATVALS